MAHYFIDLHYYTPDDISENDAQAIAAEMVAILCQYGAYCTVDAEVDVEH